MNEGVDATEIIHRKLPKLNIDLTVRDDHHGMIIRREKQGVEQTLYALNSVLLKMNPPLQVQIVKAEPKGNGRKP